VLAALPMISLLTKSGAAPVGPRVPVRDARLSQTTPECELDTPDSLAVVRFVIDHFDARAATLSVNVSMCIPQALLMRVRSMDIGHEPATIGGTNSVLRARPRYRNVPIGIFYQQFGPTTDPNQPEGGLLANNVLTSSFGRLVDGPLVPGTGARAPGVAFLGRLRLTLQSAPDRYPFDWYATFGVTDAEFGANGPSPIGLLNRYDQYAPPAYNGYIPFRLDVLQAADISPFVVQAGASAEPNGGSSGVTLQLVRRGTTKLWVVVIAFIPLLLAAALAAVVFGSSSSTGRLKPEGFAGLVAVLLAVLPIRIVLVPADLSDITLVDYLLGFEVAMLTALGCLGARNALR
jgi:hypothetical protein